MSKLRKTPFWALTLAIGGVIGACVTQSLDRSEGLAREGLDFATAANAAPPYDAKSEPIVQAVQEVARAVVSIDTTAQVGYRVFDDPFDEFMGRGRIERREVPTGAGSGVLLAGGYVLTNQHVVEGAVENEGRITVILPDGRRLSGSAVGADRSTDIALIKVTGANLPVAAFGIGDTLVPGQTVIAIGNPVGLSASVSSGVVSALGRPVAMEGRMYENLIQTDAAINPGNSGGALIDLGGRVVGINTLVRADAQNIGFAIPIATALRVADELKRYGKVRRPWTGLVVVSVNPRIAAALNLPAPRGVAVRGIYRGSPADRAGLRPYDVILEMAGKPVQDEADYHRLLRSLKIGQEVGVTVLRNGEQGSARLRLGEAP